MDPRLHASKDEIEERWTLDDALDAHISLDLMDDLDAAASEASRKGGR